MHLNPVGTLIDDSAVDHLSIQNIGVNSHAAIDIHIADGSFHFTEASIDHANIQNIGVNSHAVIDSALATIAAHILDDTIHFVDKDSTSIADFTIGEKFYLTQRLSAEPVSRINVVLQGSGGQSVTWELRKASSLNAAGVVIHTATTTSVTTGDTITSITLPAIVAGDHVWFEFTASAGTLTAFNATVSF